MGLTKKGVQFILIYQKCMNILRGMEVDKKKEEPCCVPENMTCCKIEALVSIDDRGQMVLPKELRKKANIHAGDKLVITSWEKDGEVCCIFLTKAEELSDMMRTTLRPVMKDITK